LSTFGWDTVEVDVRNVALGDPVADMDLLNDSLWQLLLKDVAARRYAAVWLGTPCTTFSVAKGRPLRSLDAIYGLPRRSAADPSGLSQEEVLQVQQGTYFAQRSIEVLALALRLGIPAALENPSPWPGRVSIFLLPEMLRLLESAGVDYVDFHQCPMGAETAKPTRVVSVHCDMSSLVGWCDHRPQWWRYRTPARRWARCFRPHPPLKGRILDDGSWATAAAAAYPSEMYRRIAEAFVACA